jgi:hypothetical protein
VASGLVARLDRPSGNTTGFATYEAALGGKCLELLSEIAPGLKRVAIMVNPDALRASAHMPSLERRPGRLRSCQPLRPSIATPKSKRPSSPLGASRGALNSFERGDVAIEGDTRIGWGVAERIVSSRLPTGKSLNSGWPESGTATTISMLETPPD